MSFTHYYEKDFNCWLVGLNYEVLSNPSSCEEWLEVGVGLQAEPAAQAAEV